MALTSESTVRVLFCDGRGDDALSGANLFAAIRGLLERGFPVSRREPGDLPGAENGQGGLLLGKFAAGPGEANLDSVPSALEREDITGWDTARIVARAEGVRARLSTGEAAAWKPWFPVIDYDRCTNCMQCLSFCLFGVYGVDAQQKIQAQNHDQCKTNCPACSRVCPEAAIMFPKYKAGPINGDVVREGDVGKEKMKIDISALLGGDVYSALRQRSETAKARFSQERDEKKALQERQKCLAKLASGGDIPLEVLMSLPSPEEIQRRAEDAKAKATAALAAQPK